MPTAYQTRTVVPSFTLPDTKGGEVSLWDYKHGPAVVMIVDERGDPELLASFARHRDAYRALRAEVLAVLGPDASPPADLPYPVLIDAARERIPRLAGTQPAVLVLDTYNELQVRLHGLWPHGPPHGELLEWIGLTEMQCDECGVSEWVTTHSSSSES